MGPFRHSFRAIGCDHVILTTDVSAIENAAAAAVRLLAELDLAASRFRDDSEISGILRRAVDEDVHVVVSPLLGGCVEAALHAADITDGLVDPTVGAAVIAAGYDADIEQVRRRGSLGPPGARGSWPDVPGWASVAYNPATRLLSLRRGTLLDLGATAKAYAADVLADRLARQLNGGFLVNFGGDIAVAGLLPTGGWDIGVEDERGSVRQVVVSTGQAIATSSTRLRSWIADGERRHHIIDPRTGRSAEPVWSQVTCAGVSALEANAASTAAVVLGDEAPDWLAGHGIPARLDATDGGTMVTPGWPDPQRSAA